MAFPIEPAIKMVQKVVELGRATGNQFVSAATFLPVKRWRNIISFLRTSSKIESQLKKSDGLVRYGVKTDLPHKRFWTYSVWTSRETMHRFVKTEPHATAVGKFAEWAGEGAAFVQWDNSEGTVDWNQANERLENPTFYYKK